jgi:hypothetical protein
MKADLGPRKAKSVQKIVGGIAVPTITGDCSGVVHIGTRNIGHIV